MARGSATGRRRADGRCPLVRHYQPGGLCHVGAAGGRGLGAASVAALGRGAGFGGEPLGTGAGDDCRELARAGRDRARDFAARPDAEPQQTVLRIFFSAAGFAYLGGLRRLTAWPVRRDADAALAIAVMGTLASWLIFLHCVVAPESAVRRGFALACDALVLGAFLHWGDAAAAPWAAVFLVRDVRLGPALRAANADRRGAGERRGFAAAVVATTAFWRETAARRSSVPAGQPWPSRPFTEPCCSAPNIAAVRQRGSPCGARLRISSTPPRP